MFNYDVTVSDIKLNSNDISHVLLVDMMLQQLFINLDIAIKYSNGIYDGFNLSLDSYYYLNLVCNDKVWCVELLDDYELDHYTYQKSIKVKLNDLKLLAKNREHRIEVIKSLMPIGNLVFSNYEYVKFGDN